MLRVLSLFSGIGAFEVALDEENIEWELDHYCEIDKYACQSYNCIHGTTDEDNLKDVTNIDYSKIGNVDLVTYGFPCQDISLAGKGKGFFDEEGNLTRSGLFFNAADIVRHTKPKFAIFENVKNLTGKKFKAEFETVLSTLDELGYNTYWKVLNAKDYGIPQNRERVFGISIRKDIDHGYEFPLPVELTLRLKDMLEDNVDEKFYIKKDHIERIAKWKSFQNPLDKVAGKESIMSTITTRVAESDGGGVSASAKFVCNDFENDMNVRKLLVKEATKKGYAEAEIGDSINLEQPNSKTRRGTVGKGVAQTLITSCNQAVVESSYIEKKYDTFIEKNGYVPEMFNPYNCAEITDVAPTQSTQCGGTTSSATVLKMEQVICRSVGRNPENPSSRKAGEPTEQRIEVNTKGLCNTLTTVQKDNLVIEPKIFKQDIVFPVRVRKYEVDTTKLCECLRNHKGNLTNKQISDKLNQPLTLVEHWFRKDSSFAIPNEEIWFQLKDLLGIETSEFDESIMTFETKDNCFEKSNRCYHINGISPTLTSTSADEKIIESFRIRKLTPRECWRLMGFKDKYFDRVKGVSNTQLYKQAGNSIVVDVLKCIFEELHNQYPEYFSKDEWGSDL